MLYNFPLHKDSILSDHETKSTFYKQVHCAKECVYLRCVLCVCTCLCACVRAYVCACA